MNYLSVKNISKTYGEKVLFEDISFGIDEGQKVALIAGNGTGKSTLLNMIMGIDIPDSGSITLNSDIRIAYLPQSQTFDQELSVLDLVLSSNNKFVKIIQEYESAIKLVEQNPSAENQKLLSDAISQMDAFEAWDYDSKVKEVLGRLGLMDLSQKVKTISGGQLRKAALAKVLVDEADFLILDEPTNHLDIEMIEWLEFFLQKQKMAILIVTHDRYFLDNTCDEIFEIDNKSFYHYKGDYSYFVEKKAEREAALRVETERAQNLYRTELEWMRQMPKARTHKSKARIDAFYELEAKAKQKIDETISEFQIKERRTGKNILEINNLSKSYNKKDFIIKDFSHVFKRGERVGVVGPNGSGKSTFFKVLMGETDYDSGNIKIGQTIVFGYFSQNNPEIKGDKRVLEIVKDIAEEIVVGEKNSMSASQFLYHFGFDYNTQYNYYSNLSGGEKRRLFLCITLIKNPNFLILDEPTNDLDIKTINVLEEFLIGYSGCLMIATHDRAFLDKISSHLFIFEGNGEITKWYSSYSLYKQQKNKEKQIEKASEKTDVVKNVSVKTESKNKPTFKQKQEYENLTLEIENLEKEKENLLNIMNSEKSDLKQITDASSKYAEVVSLLEEKEHRWLELSELF
ncbi:MAG: ABC-F family ATP-binding cassette domain-containing protein [Bacteroidales bacterium]|nr:ABC-F family ATP-binding cassette domain-containing protein [Bacteroidales bacterium]